MTMSTTKNELRSSWPIQGGYIEVNIVTNNPLPAVAWPEVAVLMSVCQQFATKVATFSYSAPDPTDQINVETDDTTVITAVSP
jgi:hypothetical protein